MAENAQGRLPCNPEDLREAVRIHTKKITDSCRDKDCVEDLRVYFTCESQEILNKATSVKARCAELIDAELEVEQVAFNRNHYCVDITFYYRITVDAMCGCNRPITLCGLAVFCKRAVLCGEDSQAKIFTSSPCCQDGISCDGATMPTAVVEVLDPMILSAKLKEGCDCGDGLQSQVPERVAKSFDGELYYGGDHKRLCVTLGQFSLIRLERDAQLLVPTFPYKLPTKVCCDDPGCAEDPCELFSRIAFPENRFFPKGCGGSCPVSGGCHCENSCDDHQDDSCQ